MLGDVLCCVFCGLCSIKETITAKPVRMSDFQRWDFKIVSGVHLLVWILLIGMMVKKSNHKSGKRSIIGVFMGNVNTYADLIWAGIAEKAEEQDWAAQLTRLGTKWRAFFICCWADCIHSRSASFVWGINPPRNLLISGLFHPLTISSRWCSSNNTSLIFFPSSIIHLLATGCLWVNES